MQELYAEPIKDELIGTRIEEIKAGGRRRRARRSPPRGSSSTRTLVLEAGLDILVIQGTVVSGGARLQPKPSRST